MVLSKVPPLPFWKYFYTYENETPPKYLMKYTAHQLLQLMDVLSFSQSCFRIFFSIKRTSRRSLFQFFGTQGFTVESTNGLLLFVFNCFKINRNHLKSSHQRCSVKKMFLEISQNSQENTCARVSFLIKLQA